MARRLEDQLAQLLDAGVESLDESQRDHLSEFLATVDLPLDPEPKATKAQAAYTETGPEPHTCIHCEHWADGRCEIVEGNIDPEGSCKWWRGSGDEEAPEHQAQGIVAVTNKTAG